MFRTTCILAAAALSIAALFAGAAAAQITLKINESLGPGSPEEVALLHFNRLLKKSGLGWV